MRNGESGAGYAEAPRLYEPGQVTREDFVIRPGLVARSRLVRPARSRFSLANAAAPHRVARAPWPSSSFLIIVPDHRSCA